MQRSGVRIPSAPPNPRIGPLDEIVRRAAFVLSWADARDREIRLAVVRAVADAGEYAAALFVSAAAASIFASEVRRLRLMCLASGSLRTLR